MNWSNTMTPDHTLVLNGIKFDGVIAHPNRRSKYINRLPTIIWIQVGSKSEIFDMADSLGYKYEKVGSVVTKRLSTVKQFQKYRLADKQQISGIRKPWH